MNINFIVFGLTRLGIEPGSTVLVADALSTRPLIGLKKLKDSQRAGTWRIRLYIARLRK